MSFILEALKKSEQKRRNEGKQAPPSIHERTSLQTGKSKRIIIILLGLLVVIGVGLLSYIVFLQQSDPVNSELVVTPRNSTLPAQRSKPVSVPPAQIAEEIKPSPSLVSPDPRPKPQVVAKQQQQFEVQPKQKPVIVDSASKLRNEEKIYLFDQLPISVSNGIPALKMMLHAYNRNDASASLVQLNGQILREGDSVTTQIRLQQITAEGVVLRYDGYSFLVLRRMN